MTNTALIARSAFEGTIDSPMGGGLVATARDGLRIASLNVRRGQRAALLQRFAAQFGLELPDGAWRAAEGNIAVAGTGPGTWWVCADEGGAAFIATLKTAVGDSGSVADQSDGYAVIRLCGAGLRETLSKLVPLDLHPRAFAVGQVAGTLLAHMGCQLWRLEDDEQGHAVFEVAVFRSLAASLWQALRHHSLSAVL